MDLAVDHASSLQMNEGMGPMFTKVDTEDLLNAPDVTRERPAKMLDWGEEEVRESIRNLFVTGDWSAGQEQEEVQNPVPRAACRSCRGGGGGLGAVNFVCEISRFFKLATKFPTQNPGPCNWHLWLSYTEPAKHYTP